MNNYIYIRGARQHNLKNINIKIPKNKLVVFTGLSGSGKSSLAYDTIYADGQRRYVESLSSYARQFLGIMDKADVDQIEGLSPAIAISQKSLSANPRSTVATVTEIYDYLRLLFARIGHPHCPQCGREIAQQSVQQITDSVLSWASKKLTNSTNRQLRLMILSPVVRDRKGEFSRLLDTLKSRGFTRVRIDNYIYDLSEDITLIKTNKHTIEVIIDRLTIDRKQIKDKVAFSNLRSRILDDIEQSCSLSDGLVVISQVKDKSFAFPEKPKKMEDHLYSEKFSCPVCNLSLPEIEPRSFSFNSPHGACPTCNGIGTLMKVDESLVINPKLSISEGGILPFASQFEHDTWYSRIIKTVCRKNNIPLDKPLSALDEEQKKILFYGTGDEIHRVEGTNRRGEYTAIYETFNGIIAELEQRYQKSDSEHVRHSIEKYMKQKTCSTCQGTRLKKEALSITIDGKSIADITRLSIKQASRFIKNLKKGSILSSREQTIAEPIIKELNNRLNFLVSVGLDYLTLDRQAGTLAGGEAQRIQLASQIGSGLSGVIYVLDEPTIGLHQRDNIRLIRMLKHLRDLGNTVIVVEHDREVIENADIIYDFGPGAGKQGGQIVAYGTPEEIKKNNHSLTGKYLSNKKRIKIVKHASRWQDDNWPKEKTSEENNHYLTIRGCSQFNLKNIEVSFPLGKFTCVTGVSGSGKSTLVVETLYHALAQYFNPYHRYKPGKFTQLEGVDKVDKVVLIDQSPIGRTPRSNPATYTGVFSYIRQLFAQLPQARSMGYRMGRFSFNVKSGRCEECQGQGEIKIEMQFLPDVYVTCEVCQGKRYNRNTLEIRFKGKNIADILAMTVKEALEFFAVHPAIVSKLQTLSDVGLDYIKLGQPAPTLSGGEAQRVKLATHLSKKATGKTIFILDEPTTGLHFADLEKLIKVLRRLVDQGNSVIVIEHNLDVIKNADWVIDLGPEGGADGGRVVATGTPFEIAKNKESHTGRYLRDIL